MRSIGFGSFLGAAVVAGAAGMAYAQAAPPIKPGLWQVQTQHEADGQTAQMPDMSEHLKNLPPEARKQVEAMMKERGVDMSAGGGAVRICLTKESLDRGQWQHHQGSCKTDVISRTASTWKWHTSCSDPASETDGEATFSGPESYTVKATTITSAQGHPKTTRMTMKSKWMGADCGDVRPVTPRP